MAASEAAVAAVMEALGCERRSVGELGFCAAHWQMASDMAWTARGCPVAVAAADAAADADRASIQAEALREAAGEVDIFMSEGYTQADDARATTMAEKWLCARADRIEGKP
jgi:hypothetical protein